MNNRKLEALLYFLLGVLFVGLAYFLFEEFKPVGNVKEYTQENTLSWVGHRIGKIPIVIGFLFVSFLYFYKCFRLLKIKN
ncbi:MAG TPA: hypothetical protein PLC92_01115 [Chitinophagales bacterium]|jgi:hypothetical protein|nr:hypothetical protein [Chitinophagales bacterium]